MTTPIAYMRKLISTTGLARRLDIDPRTLNQVLARCEIQPDFLNGTRKLFVPARLETLGKQIREAMR